MARQGKGLPPALNIAGRVYSIVPDSKRAKDLNQLGFCDLCGFEIHLDSKGQHEDSLRDTVLHEALHAVSSVAQLDLEERQVYVLAAQLLDMFKRNPKFTRWLLS